ncbi:hypothetical protein [Candidatus Nitrosotenuis sp. DW1]|uniref:hypothetical protein n=1 Tax=Candidatus Nitrosotenuis sp. DW1 TaxID=2259672 RepID=UPI0015CAEC57|nr:hypothetical protein [Candidatus Nitrosotenuis sp. DW1]QLH08826.1 hypothetical protein DSQ19_04415 [Candidatus Nitrosotenuis sp. DW1]
MIFSRIKKSVQIHTNAYIVSSYGVSLPRKEYKTISIKVRTFVRFVKEAKDAKKKDSSMSNTRFLDHLLDLRTAIGSKPFF